MNKPKRRKKVQCEVIRRKDREFLYAAMDDLVGDHHDHLKAASIALAWRYGWAADRHGEGMVQISKLVLASDLDREFRTKSSGFDAVLLLNHELFSDGEVSVPQLMFALDSALESMQPQLDEEGEQKLDEKGRRLWRTKKPDIQIHSQVYQRHGCVWEYLAEFRRIIEKRADADRPLLKALEDAETLAMPNDDEAA